MSKLAGAAKHPLAVVVYVLTAALPGFLEWLEERDTSTEVHLEQKIRDLQEAAIHQNIQANADERSKSCSQSANQAIDQEYGG